MQLVESQWIAAEDGFLSPLGVNTGTVEQLQKVDKELQRKKTVDVFGEWTYDFRTHCIEYCSNAAEFVFCELCRALNESMAAQLSQGAFRGSKAAEGESKVRIQRSQNGSKSASKVEGRSQSEPAVLLESARKQRDLMEVVREQSELLAPEEAEQLKQQLTLPSVPNKQHPNEFLDGKFYREKQSLIASSTLPSSSNTPSNSMLSISMASILQVANNSNRSSSTSSTPLKSSTGIRLSRYGYGCGPDAAVQSKMRMMIPMQQTMPAIGDLLQNSLSNSAAHTTTNANVNNATAVTNGSGEDGSFSFPKTTSREQF